jgi:hypothetical protein
MGRGVHPYANASAHGALLKGAKDLPVYASEAELSFDQS